VEIKAAHSKIGASSYSRWSKTHGGCPASVKLSEGLKSTESEYAKEGTLAHEIAASFLEKYFFNKEFSLPKRLPEDMVPAVKEYVEFVKTEALAAKASASSGHVLIEHKFDLSSVHPGLFGTADAVIYNPIEKRLTVIDYKHGAGIPVEVEENLQLQYYGLGALLSTNYPCKEIELVIVQPRCEHPEGAIRKWKTDSIQLLDYAATLAEDAAHTEAENPAINPGKHCRFCPAAAFRCTAIHEKALTLARSEFKQELSYDPEKLATALSHLPAIEAWIKQVREFAHAEAIHGRMPPGWKLVEKRATRKWKVEEEKIVEVMKEVTLRDANEFYDLKLKSPAQLEKFLNKNTVNRLRELSESISSGYTLVPVSDKRPSALVDPKAVFDVIED